MIVELDERELSLIKFALYRMLSSAWHSAEMAAQDKAGRHYPKEAFDAFMKDADDISSLMLKLQRKETL